MNMKITSQYRKTILVEYTKLNCGLIVQLKNVLGCSKTVPWQTHPARITDKYVN